MSRGSVSPTTGSGVGWSTAVMLGGETDRGSRDGLLDAVVEGDGGLSDDEVIEPPASSTGVDGGGAMSAP